MRLLIGRTDGPFQFTCDHCRFSLLAHEALEHANVFFCPRAELQGFLCHSTSSRNSMLRISSNLSNIDKSTQRQSTSRLGTQVNATPSKVTWCCACGSTVPLCTIKLNPKSSASESSGCRRNQEDSFFFPPMRSVNPDSEPCLPPPQQLDSDKRCSIMRCKAQTLQL